MSLFVKRDNEAVESDDMKNYGELCELLPGLQPVCGFSGKGIGANTHLGGKLFKSLALAWSLELGFWLVICGQVGLLPLQRHGVMWL